MDGRRANVPAIAAGAIVMFAFGSIWYTIFAAPWLAAVGRSKDDLAATGVTPFAVSLVAGLVSAYFLDLVLSGDQRCSAATGAKLGLLAGLCVAGSVVATTYTFELRPVSLTLIDAGYGAVGLLLVGTVVGALRSRARRRSTAAATT